MLGGHWFLVCWWWSGKWQQSEERVKSRSGLEVGKKPLGHFCIKRLGSDQDIAMSAGGDVDEAFLWMR